MTPPRPEDRRGTPRSPSHTIVWLALALGLGIVLDRQWPWLPLGWATMGLLFSLASLTIPGPTIARPISLLLAIIAMGGFLHHVRFWQIAPDDLSRFVSEESRPAWVRGVLLEVPEYYAETPGVLSSSDAPSGYTRTTLALRAIHDRGQWRPISGRAVVAIAGNRLDLAPGTPYQAAGLLGRIRGPLNPGEYDPRPSFQARGIRSRLSVDHPSAIWRDPDGPQWPVTSALGDLRVWSHDRLTRHLDPRVASLAAALLLGRRSGLPNEVLDQFGRTGTMHLLAISGLHLHTLALVFLFMARLGNCPQRLQFILVAVLVIAYATLVGWMPSVARSAAMTLTVCAAFLVGRRPRRRNLLALAAIVTLLMNPADLFHPGWQLSFVAVAALLWGVPLAWEASHVWWRILPLPRSWVESPSEASLVLDRLERQHRTRWRTWLDQLFQKPPLALVTSAVVCVVTTPLTMWWFHLVSPIGILLNLLLAFPMSMALIASALTLTLGWIGPLGDLFGWLCSSSLRLSLAIVDGAEFVPGGYAFVPSPPLAWVLAAYLIFLAFLLASRSSYRRALLGLMVVHAGLGALLINTARRPPTHEVEVLAVGHGLAILVQAPDGRAFLYDCGRAHDPSVGRRIIAPALWARGIRRLDAVVLSHSDLDHLDGLNDLLDRFEIQAIYGPRALTQSHDPTTRSSLARARALGVPIGTMTRGQAWRLGSDLLVRVLHPPDDWPADAADNDGSLVLDVAVNGQHLLLTGDLDGAGLTSVIESLPPARYAAVLAPHHGGRTANPDHFYEWAQTSTLLVSQQSPRPGSVDVLETFESNGKRVLRTWRDGAIRLAWSSKEVEPTAVAQIANPPRQASVVPVRLDLQPAPERPERAEVPITRGRVALNLVVVVLGIALGLVAVLVMAIIEWGAWSLVFPRRKPEMFDPLPEPWRSLETRAADGTLLRAWWIDAPNPTSATAILVHGFGETGPALLERADWLRSLGWNICLPDARAFGRSDGRFASFGGREADDLRLWIDALEAQPGQTPPLLVWGRSMGAAISLRAVADDPRIQALILEAPYADLRATVAAWLRRLPIPGASRLAGPLLWRAHRLAGVSLDRPRAIDHAAQVRQATIILHGLADRIVGPSDLHALQEAFPEETRVQILEIPDAGHSGVFEGCDAARLAALAAFVEANFATKRP